MNFRILFATILAILMLSMPLSASAAEDSLTPLQIEEVESIIEEYLVDNPEILIRAMNAYRAKQKRADMERQARILAHMDKELRHNPNSPVAGNPQGDITIVEFFDYRCQDCKMVLPMIKKLLEADSNIRVVFKELPILGPDSVIASQAAIAVWKFAPEKYMRFHIAMMNSRGKVTEKKVFRLADDIGVDSDKLRQWLKDPAIEKELASTSRIAEALGISGTPAFVIGDQVVPGAIDEETLNQMVAELRRNK